MQFLSQHSKHGISQRLCCPFFFFFHRVSSILQHWFTYCMGMKQGWNERRVSSRNVFFYCKKQIHEKLLSVIFTTTTSFSFILENPRRGKWSRAWGTRWSCWWGEWLEENWMDLVGQQLLVHLELAPGISLLWPWNHLQQPRVAWKNQDLRDRPGQQHFYLQSSQLVRRALNWEQKGREMRTSSRGSSFHTAFPHLTLPSS